MSVAICCKFYVIGFKLKIATAWLSSYAVDFALLKYYNLSPLKPTQSACLQSTSPCSYTTTFDWPNCW